MRDFYERRTALISNESLRISTISSSAPKSCFKKKSTECADNQHTQRATKQTIKKRIMQWKKHAKSYKLEQQT